MSSFTPEMLEQLLNGPALKPPPGEPIELIDVSTHIWPWHLVTLVLCLFFTTAAATARVYTKARITRALAREDYVFIAAYLAWIGYCVVWILMMKTGSGVHQWNIRLRDFGTLLKYDFVMAILYCIAMCLTKVSILLQYLHFFVPVKKTDFVWWSAYGLIGINVVFYFIWIFANSFACSPVQKYWTPWMLEGTCMDFTTLFIVPTVVNSFTDFVILILPQIVIWRLQLSAKRKLGVATVFFTGFLACVVSVMRLYFIVKETRELDFVYYIAPILLLLSAELSLGLIISCIPILPKYVQTMQQRYATWSKNRSGSLRSLFRSDKRSQMSGPSAGSSADGPYYPRDDSLCSNCRGNPPNSFAEKSTNASGKDARTWLSLSTVDEERRIGRTEGVGP